MFNLRNLCLSLCFVLTTGVIASAQGLPEPLVKKVNALFDYWNQIHSPGCTVGIVRNDSLIFSNGYGMANLEYSVVNSPETVYHLASVSKQFTAYAIILLANQGKLNLDDDIHKYLPWFPDMKQKITIRNLLNHTSGIRDQWQLLAISGTRLDDVITQDHIIKVLSKQTALNFKPGEKFLYSNSGYTMLAEIVKSATGQTLREFTDALIFNPLRMNNTHFHDDYTEIEKNRAASYERKNSTEFKNSILSYSNAGATSLFSNINDLAKWVINFYDTKVGTPKTISELTQNAKLNDGTKLDYAAGITSTSYKGWTSYSHDGADAGFRTSISIYPELKIGIIVLCNLGELNAREKANQIADLLISEKAPLSAKTSTEKEEIKRGVKIPAEELPFIRKQLGNYFSNDMGTASTFKLKNDSLFMSSSNNDYLMAREAKNVYSIFYLPTYKFTFNEDPAKNDVIFNVPDIAYNLTRLPDQKIEDDKSLLAYTGKYYCPELDCTYGIALKDHHLYLTNSKYNDIPLNLFGTDHLVNDTWYMSHLLVTRDKSKRITGFEVTGSRITGLKFIRQSGPKQ